MLRIVLLFFLFFTSESQALETPSRETFSTPLTTFGGASPFPFRDVLDQQNVVWFQFANGDYIAIFSLPQSKAIGTYAVAFYDRYLSNKKTGLGRIDGLIFVGEYTPHVDKVKQFQIKAFVDDNGNLFFCFFINGLSYRLTLI